MAERGTDRERGVSLAVIATMSKLQTKSITRRHVLLNGLKHAAPRGKDGLALDAAGSILRLDHFDETFDTLMNAGPHARDEVIDHVFECLRNRVLPRVQDGDHWLEFIVILRAMLRHTQHTHQVYRCRYI